MELEKLDIDCYVEERICRLLKVDRGFFIEIHERVYNHFNQTGEGAKNDKSNSNLHEHSSSGNYS